MIQRIQSVFLFLACVVGILFFIFPLAELVSPETKHVLYANGLFKADNETVAQSFSTWPLIIIATLSIILSGVIIFLFKNRKLQMRLCRLDLLLHVGWIVLIFLYIDKASSFSESATKNYSFGLFLPILSAIFVMLAHRGVKKDEALVRSADRIR